MTAPGPFASSGSSGFAVERQARGAVAAAADTTRAPPLSGNIRRSVGFIGFSARRPITDGVLFEQSSDEGRVEVRANANDDGIPETDHPAVAVVETHAVLRGRERAELYDGLVVLDDQVLDDELRAVRQNLPQLGERSVDER